MADESWKTSYRSFYYEHAPIPQDLDLDRLFEDRNLGPVTELLEKGDYDLVARMCEAAIQRGMKAPEWRLLRLQALHQEEPSAAPT